MSSEPPDPPDAVRLDPLIHIWRRGAPIRRCHDSRFGATELNPGLGGGRFHPLLDAGGRPVPTLYGSDDADGAISETVFHAVPVRGGLRGIRRAALKSLLISTVAARRDLRLAQLHGHGLRRLEVSRAELIGGDADGYPATRRWAAALYACPARPDGLVWTSRQYDTSLALVLFGDRVERGELEIAEPPLPLAWGPGLELVERAAEAADLVLFT